MELSSDLLKTQYPKNPFKLMVDLWEEGFYVCGIVDKKFIIYYVPKKK
jgi:hypothetical protein